MEMFVESLQFPLMKSSNDFVVQIFFLSLLKSVRRNDTYILSTSRGTCEIYAINILSKLLQVSSCRKKYDQRENSLVRCSSKEGLAVIICVDSRVPDAASPMKDKETIGQKYLIRDDTTPTISKISGHYNCSRKKEKTSNLRWTRAWRVSICLKYLSVE